MTLLLAGLNGCAPTGPASEPKAQPAPAATSTPPVEPSPGAPVASSTLAPQPSPPPDYRAAAAYGAPPPMSPSAVAPSAPVAEPVASAASVEISETKATGVLGANGSAERVILGAEPALRNCYQKALANTKAAAGTAKFRISVGVGGTALRVETPTTGGLPAGPVSCMVTQLGLLQFSQGSTSTVSFTATFKP